MMAQDPAKILTALAAHVQAHCPAGVAAEPKPGKSGRDRFWCHPGIMQPPSPRRCWRRFRTNPPVRTRLGGSNPVMTTLLDVLGVHAAMFGVLHDDENLHAPNEFRLDAFRLGQAAYVRLLQRLGA